MKEESNKEMTLEEFRERLSEMVRKYGKQEGAPPKSNSLALATVDTLNQLYPAEGESDINRPKVGDDIYVDTSLYTTHGVDDFIGGLSFIII